MHPSLQKEIPEFLNNSIIYCDNLTYKKNERSCFVLTKNLMFYEFRKKQLLHSFDLSNTCFADLKQRIMTYDGQKCKFSGYADVNNDAESSCTKASKITSQQSIDKSEIKFGKYIYKNFDASKLYLLLNCWNKLVVLQRLSETTTDNLRFVAEYENVMNFKLVPSTIMKHQAVVKLQFHDGSFICMDFEKHEKSDKLSNKAIQFQQKSEFKQLLERVRHTKAELQFHKEITHKKFQNLQNKQTFGSNFLRNTKVDEKPMLSRCGDVWMRVTSGDELVLGLPLVNNCAPGNLTILKNLQPVLNISSSDKDMSNKIVYEYRIYQLQQTFENLETLETFFQSEVAEFKLNTWTITDAHVLPTSFVVLVLKLRLSQVILIEEKCQLLVRFQIEKDLEMIETETHTFEQHLFIKSLDFQDILLERQKNEINFNEKTLHQDFLALTMSGFHRKLQIDFSTDTDRNEFEHLLVEKFDFEIVHREAAEEFNDNDNRNECKRLPCTLFYNRKPSSIWFGALIVRDTAVQMYNEFDTFRTFWAFYNKNEEKAILMFKLLFAELITIKCNIIDIKEGQECQHNDTKIANFENAMRQELTAFLSIANNESGNTEKSIQKIKLLLQLQYNTDMLAAEQCHNV